MIHSYAWLLSILFIFLLAAVFLFAAFYYQQYALNSSDYTLQQQKIRKWVFWCVLIIVTPVMIYTLTILPYNTVPENDSTMQNIDVTGHMWVWEMSKSKVKANQPILFHVTSDDVNHGFGIYDKNYTLLAQTQAMPGYTNTLQYTFDKPGIYYVLCLEYCGIAHHNMTAQLSVTE